MHRRHGKIWREIFSPCRAKSRKWKELKGVNRR